jgi:hypothetical protein
MTDAAIADITTIAEAVATETLALENGVAWREGSTARGSRLPRPPTYRR